MNALKMPKVHKQKENKRLIVITTKKLSLPGDIIIYASEEDSEME